MYIVLIVEKVVAYMYLAFGLSLVLHNRYWLDFIDYLRKEPFRAMGLPLISLPLGLTVVLLHNIWELTPSVFVTIFGWAAVLQSCLFLFFPKKFIENTPNRLILRKVLYFKAPILIAICLLVLEHAHSG